MRFIGFVTHDMYHGKTTTITAVDNSGTFEIGFAPHSLDIGKMLYLDEENQILIETREAYVARMHHYIGFRAEEGKVNLN